MSNRERQRRYRARKKAAAVKASAQVPTPLPADPIGALAKWSRETLCVPPGHPLSGQPLSLPDYGESFLRDALRARESLLCLGRKNAKSAIVAVFLLGRLVGPIAFPGYRAGVASVNKEKAGELKRQMQEIAEASNLQGLRFLRSPAPGRVESATGTVDILSADKSAGHASGFDESIVDELGLLSERDRGLVNGLRTATSARDGRFIALSIMGDAPFTAEMVERRDDPGTVVHLYQAPDDCALDDPAAWHAANPGLAAGIKSIAYMRDEARRVLSTPTDQASYRAFDLNQPQSPSREMIFAPSDLRECFVSELPERRGDVVLGLDMGEATSASAAFAIWPQTGRCESWMAFGDVPDLVERGKRDGARYDLMAQRGELRTYPGRVTPVSAFLADVAGELAGSRVHRLAADGYKDSEIRDFLDRAGLRWPHEFRRVGAGKDGGRDVRAFQRLVLTGKLRMLESLALSTAIANSAIHRDANGNPGLDKAKSRGRIDVLSAAVIAAGLAEPLMDRKPKRRRFYRGAVG
ncbi:MAG: terminase large subunit [Thiotrichales bacterium]|nr:terminase large subunit [Thiotrichales bacterium]